MATAHLLRRSQHSPTVPPGVAELLGAAAEQVEHALGGIRALGDELESPADGQATWLGGDSAPAEPCECSPAAGTAYAVVLEGITNAVRHAHARRVQVRCTASTRLEVCVHDDGIGGAQERADGGGLKDLRDRVEALGGTLELSSTPGLGSVLMVQLPWGGDTRTPSRSRVAA